MTINDIYFKYIGSFKEANLSELSLRILLCEIFKFQSMSDLELNRDKDVNLKAKDEELINKALKGIPVQYLVHKASFYNMDFYVDKRVLIPRPETEELVYETIKKINETYIFFKKPINIYDLGTGSGCIAIALDKTLNLEHKVYAYDKSLQALAVAIKNNKRFNASVEFKRGNILKEISFPTKINVLISNPPYIENVNEIDKNVFDYEPHMALLSKPGTLFYEKILENCRVFLEKPFILAFEIGYDQKEKIENYLKINQYYRENTKWEVKKDMEGKDRFLFIESL